MQLCNRFLNVQSQTRQLLATHTQQQQFFARTSIQSSPVSQCDPVLDWNADTGATSHMTPHRHYLREYRPHRVPIHLANNKVIYSAGIGSVVFTPNIYEHILEPLEFTNVLHVPELQNNLLSVLFLTRHRQFTVRITEKAMHFVQHGKELCIAPISAGNTAYLSGITQCAPESVFSALASTSTLPLSLSLWHRRFVHHSWDTVKQMQSEALVDGMTVSSVGKKDPICEPCQAGKLSAAPFHSSASRASQPLELVHSDLHGPMSTSTHDGYRYWITFIDDCTKF